MRYDLANNQSTPFYNDIGEGRFIAADQNEGLVFFNDYSSDTLYRMNYMGDQEAIAIRNEEGKFPCQSNQGHHQSCGPKVQQGHEGVSE